MDKKLMTMDKALHSRWYRQIMCQENKEEEKDSPMDGLTRLKSKERRIISVSNSIDNIRAIRPPPKKNNKKQNKRKTKKIKKPNNNNNNNKIKQNKNKTKEKTKIKQKQKTN